MIRFTSPKKIVKMLLEEQQNNYATALETEKKRLVDYLENKLS
jgi:hypothetical protein